MREASGGEVGPRVCLLLETYHPEIGGGETQGRLLVRGLVERGLPVVVVTRRSSRDFPGREILDGARIRRLPPRGRGRLRKWGLLATALVGLLRLRKEYDVILVAGFRMLGVPALLVRRALGKPVICKAESNGEMSGAFHEPGLARWGLELDSPPVRLLLERRNRLLREADRFVALSRRIEREFEAGGVPPERIHRIPNGVDTDRFRPASPEERRSLRGLLGLPAGGSLVVYAGRLVSYKGLPLLLRVWTTLAEAHPGARLVLVGGGGSDMHDCEQELREFVRANRLDERVTFTGPVSDVASYLRAADVFAFPTREEAFGIALIEAMACGLAVVAGRTGAVPEIVTHGRDGLLVDPTSSEKLRGSLEAVLADPDLRRRLGAEARETVLRHYSVGRVVERYLELFRELAGGFPGERSAAPFEAVPGGR